MGNCLQASLLPKSDDIDNICNDASINGAASIQSQSVTSDIISRSNTNNNNNKNDESPSNSSTPAVSRIAPLPHIIKRTSSNILRKNINNRHNIIENLPVSQHHMNHNHNNHNNNNNTIIVYDASTTNPSSSHVSTNYLDTPNDLFGMTPSSIFTVNSSQSTMPPLTLSAVNTLTLSSKESGNKLDLENNSSNIESISTTSPPPISPISPQIDIINDLHLQNVNITEMDEIGVEEEKELRNNKTLNRKRASSHDSMGITALFRAKTTTFSLFSLKGKRNKNANTPQFAPQSIPIADISNSIPISSRKRGQTYHSPHTSITDNISSIESKNNDEIDTIDITTNRTKRARTFHNLLSFKTHTISKKHNNNHHHSSKRPKSAKSAKSTKSFKSFKRSNSVNTNKNGERSVIKRIKYKSNTSIQPLESFVMEGNVPGIISILKKFEAYYPPFFMEYSNEQGHTLLMKAAFLGHFGLMKYLINRYTEYRDAVFDSVEPWYGKDIASLLLDFMGDYINYESKGGKSALIFACSCKHKCRLNIVKYLLQRGASVADPRYSKHGKSPLIHAVEWKQQDLIQLLLDYGADINVQDSNNGFTPLMYAAKFNNQDLCEFLLARNADKTLVNKNGKTATDLAKIDQCWASLLALDITQIPPNVLSMAAASPSKNRWGRYSLSYSYL